MGYSIPCRLCRAVILGVFPHNPKNKDLQDGNLNKLDKIELAIWLPVPEVRAESYCGCLRKSKGHTIRYRL